jgi:molecular chaperone DnaK (HSP70)
LNAVVKILGLHSNIDVQFIAQVTAAAIAYRHKEGDATQGNVLFFYMGARNTEVRNSTLFKI